MSSPEGPFPILASLTFENYEKSGEEHPLAICIRGLPGMTARSLHCTSKLKLLVVLAHSTALCDRRAFKIMIYSYIYAVIKIPLK